jgi:prophage antirepressor-like protein
MNDLRPFAFEDNLVRVIERDGEPWFVGRDVCQALELKNENDALASLDEDERLAGVAIADPSGTKYAIIISEPGVYRLVFRSRKPAAERFKRWLAHDVLPALRRDGRYGGDLAADPRPEVTGESTLHKLHLIREARALFGRDRAAVLWRQLGLPSVPPPPPTALDEARICLRQLLDGSMGSGDTVRLLIERALEDDEEARLVLIGGGIRIVSEGQMEGFAVANRHAALEHVYARTEWARGRWMRVLRRLPGTAALGPMRFGGQRPPGRSTFVPATYLDEDAAELRSAILLA